MGWVLNEHIVLSHLFSIGLKFVTIKFPLQADLHIMLETLCLMHFDINIEDCELKNISMHKLHKFITEIWRKSFPLQIRQEERKQIILICVLPYKKGQIHIWNAYKSYKDTLIFIQHRHTYIWQWNWRQIVKESLYLSIVGGKAHKKCSVYVQLWYVLISYN